MGTWGQKMLQNFLQSTWKTEYEKSNNIWTTYTDYINKNILAVLRTFPNWIDQPYFLIAIIKQM